MPYFSKQDEAKFLARLGFRHYTVAGYTTSIAAATAVETADIALSAGQQVQPADRMIPFIVGAPNATAEVLKSARCVTPNNVRLAYANASAGAVVPGAATVGLLIFPDFTAG